MTKLRALQSYPYADKQRHTGEVFDASEDDARTLVLTGLAAYADSAENPASYQTRAVKAEGDAPSPPPPTAHRRGRYPRRDMRADD